MCPRPDSNSDIGTFGQSVDQDQQRGTGGGRGRLPDRRLEGLCGLNSNAATPITG
jgi:hypothetical protein